AARELPTSEGRREAEVLIEPAGVRLLDDRDGAAVREPEVTGTDEVLHLRRGRAAGAATNAVGLSEARARVGTEDARIGQVDAGLTELARSKRCSDDAPVTELSAGGVRASLTEPPVLTAPSAKPLAVRLTEGPQQGGLLEPTSHAPEVTQRRSVRTG